jgi:hypothetical protein
LAQVIIRPTVPADLGAVIAEPLPCRIRAYTAVLQRSPDEGEGETVLGVGGLAFPADGPPIAFVQQAPEAKRYPLSFHRAGLAAMQMIAESGLWEVVATSDPDNLTAGRWLARLGFTLAERQNAPGKLLWLWRRPSL